MSNVYTCIDTIVTDTYDNIIIIIIITKTEVTVHEPESADVGFAARSRSEYIHTHMFTHVYA